MKKIIYLIAMIVLLAPPLWAQEKTPAGAQQYQLGTPFEGDVRLGYRGNATRGNPMAGEYEYQHSSLAGSANIEYDPLPHRILLETYVQNQKDYFGEFDYSYKDIIMLNMMSRSLYHNLDHYSIGRTEPGGRTVTDLNPGDLYGMSDAMNRIQVRVKTPDFPFHIYLEAKTQEKHGTIQQRFMSSYSAGDKMSRSREIDYETQEAKATVNSHLGPVEFEYSHATKNFSDTHGKVMTDTASGGQSYTHNLVPDLESSVDTVKIHTTHTGRISASATYSSGDRKNTDSQAKASFVNAAGDLGWIPTKDVTVAVKYRHYGVDRQNPDSVTSFDGTTTLTVRNAINYQKDTISGMVRYRATDKLTVRAEYAFDSLNRDVWTGDAAGSWLLDDKVTKNTGRLGATYRLTNKLMLRGDISHQTAAVPANSVDNTYPETSDAARGTLTWSPKTWFNWLLSAGTVREERTSLNPPFTDKWTTERNRVLNSFTFIVGKKTSITPSYAFFQNKQNGPIAYTDSITGGITAESAVPYADTAHVASLSVSYALADAMLFTADAGRSWSRGNWQNAGVVSGSTGIAELTSIKLVETTAGANLDIRYTKNLGTEFRYYVRKLDDILDSTQDGTSQIALATLSYRW